MISLVNKNIQGAKKYHTETVELLFNKIINREIGQIGEKKDEKGKIKDKINVKEYKLKDNVIDFLKNKMPHLIDGNPDELLIIHKEYEKLKFDNKDKNIADGFFKDVYESHFQKKNGKVFLNKLNIDTCIYCNRNYTLDFKNLTNARAQLDHWFPKTYFPILALSFYNLIPSCQSCNQIKGEGDKIVKSIIKNNKASKEQIRKWWEEDSLKHLNHPYLKSYNFKFTWIYDNSLDNIKVECKTNYNETKNTLEFNKTEDIYNAHSEKELKDLLYLRYKYSDNYIDILLNKTFKGVMSKEEAYRMIFGIKIKEEDFHKRPFSKFKHDIIEELLKTNTKKP